MGLNEVFDETVKKLEKEMTEFEAKGSRWSLYLINRFEWNVNNFYPISGSSYFDLQEKMKVNTPV